jgi:hypothetical protein
MPEWPRNDSATGRGFVQGSDSYNEADMVRMAREDERILAGKWLKALQKIRDMTTDCGVDRLLEIRMIADEALGAPHVSEKDIERIEAVRARLSKGCG